MSDTAATTETTEIVATETTETDAPDLTAEVEKWKALSKKNEDRAKANAEAAKELEKFRQQSMTETEKLVEQARAEARTATLAEAGGKVARAEIRAAAAGRLDQAALDVLIDGLNLAKFLDDDGEVDTAKVAAFVDGIAPKAEEDEKPAGFPDLGQGARSTTPLNGDPLLRDVKNALGIK